MTVESLLQVIRNLGPAKLAAITGITVALLGFFIFLTSRLGSPDLTLLYGNMDPSDSNQIQMQLALEGLPFEVRENGKEILVPASRVNNIRLKMAELGLSGSVIGYELFDKDQALGSSSFIQELNRTRALEGELSRTIASLNNVKSTRVHLVLPKRELFSRETQEASASIVLKMKGAQRLDRAQILAIQHLVSTAVERLKPSMISIIDDRGTLLAKGGSEDNQGIDEMTDMRSNYEQKLRTSIANILERTLGIGKVRVEVRASMDFTRTVINEERFDPEGQVLRSNSTQETNSSIQDGSNGTVSVGNNLPNSPDGLEQLGGTNEIENSTTETNNYEITKILTNTVKAPGKVDSLSVAVLVDGSYKLEITDENSDGEFKYQPRTADEMQQIQILVKSTIGFDEARGDIVEIVNMRFADTGLNSINEPDTYFGLSTSDIKWLAQTLILGMLAVLVILLIVRPLISKLLEATPNAIAAAAAGMEDGTLITDQSGQVIAVAGDPTKSSSLDMIDGEFNDEDEEFESMIDLAHIEGRVKASSLKKIEEIVDKHPEEAVSIIRGWLHQEQTGS